MQLATARACFEALAARGDEPALRGCTGLWEVDLEDAPEKDRQWFVRVEDGHLAVSDAAAPDARADARLHMRESDFVRLASGTGRENLLTALLRGTVTIEGDFPFAQRLQLMLPIGDGQEEVRSTP